MFRFGFGQYMQRAFPRDDLRPISCRGKDSQGGIALTLIDSLDTLVVSAGDGWGQGAVLDGIALTLVASWDTLVVRTSAATAGGSAFVEVWDAATCGVGVQGNREAQWW